MSIAAKIHPRAFAIEFKDLATWSVAAQFVAEWNWPQEVIKPLGRILKRRSEAALETLSPETMVTLLTIRFDGSIEPREQIQIKGIKGRLFRVYPGDVIFSKIDVRNGAIGLARDDIDCMCVTSEFPVYSVNIDKDGVIDFLQTIGIVAIIASPVLIFFGSCISRLVSIFLIAVIGFIVLNAMEKRNSFKTSFILALYASIPVVYVNLLFGLIAKGLSFVGISFALGSICCLIPLFCSIIKWGAFWCIGAYGLSKGEGG